MKFYIRLLILLSVLVVTPPCYVIGEDAYGNPLPIGAIARLGTIRFQLRDRPAGLYWSNDNSLIAIYYSVALGAGRPGIQIMNVDTGRTETTLILEYNEYEDLAWGPDSQELATCEPSGTIRIWDRRKQWRHRVFASGVSTCQCIAWSPDGATLAIGTSSSGVQLRDVSTGKIKGEIPGPAQRIAFSSDGIHLVIAAECTVSAYSMPNLKLQHELKVIGPDRIILMPVSLSRDGKTLATIMERDDPTGGIAVGLMDTESGMIRGKIDDSFLMITSLAISEDAKQLAVATHDSAALNGITDPIIIYNTQTGQQTHEFSGHSQMIRDIKFLPGNRLISASQDSTALVWDLSNQ